MDSQRGVGVKSLVLAGPGKASALTARPETFQFSLSNLSGRKPDGIRPTIAISDLDQPPPSLVSLSYITE
jgi:hypothetical protein